MLTPPPPAAMRLQGRLVLLLGPPGAGKSVLLRRLTCQLEKSPTQICSAAAGATTGGKPPPLTLSAQPPLSTRWALRVCLQVEH